MHAALPMEVSVPLIRAAVDDLRIGGCETITAVAPLPGSPNPNTNTNTNPNTYTNPNPNPNPNTNPIPAAARAVWLDRARPAVGDPRS